MMQVAFVACGCGRVWTADGAVKHARAAHPSCEGSQRVREALASLDALAQRLLAEERAAELEAERAKRSRGFVVRKVRGMFVEGPLEGRAEVDRTLLTEDWFTGFLPRDERQPDSRFEGRDGAMVTQAQAQLDRDTLRWCRRDEFEMHKEAKRREEQGGSVEGDRTAPGLAGERDWLATQLRAIERKHAAGGYPSREAAKKHAAALRARFNARRHVEALGGDPDGDEFAAWRKKHPMSWGAACERLAARIEKKFLECELETLAVPGLIATMPRRRAPQFARPKMTTIAKEV